MLTNTDLELKGYNSLRQVWQYRKDFTLDLINCERRETGSET